MINKQTTRLDILKKVEDGEIDLETASELLSSIAEASSITENDVNISKDENTLETDFNRSLAIKKPNWSFIFWTIPLFSGIILTIFSSTWLYQNYNSGVLGIRFWLSFIPFLIGIFLIYLGMVFQSSQWLQIQIKQSPGEKPGKIVLGFPLPIKMTAGFLNLIKRFLPPQAQQLNFSEMINALDGQVSKENPMTIHIDDEDGTQVDIFLI